MEFGRLNKLLRWGTMGALAYTAFRYVSAVEPRWVEVRHVKLKLPNLDHEFDGYRVVQFSDIHLDTGFGPEWLDDIITLINAQGPDLVAVTGDFISRRLSPYDEQLIAALSKLTPRDAAVAVLGNHDHWVDSQGVRRVIRESGMIDVSNDFHTIRRGKAMFHAAGVDDVWAKKNNLPKVLEVLPDEGAAMLLAHEPDFADKSAATGRFDLQISGHTHGGVIEIMGFSPPWWVFPPHGKKYRVGLFRVGNMWQYTNRGIGVLVPFRLNCRPEITVFTLEAGA